jgi:hypothetical protein
VLDRRDLLLLTAGLATGSLLPIPRAIAAEAGQSTPNSARDAYTIWAKLHGDLSGKTCFYTTVGDVWGFQPQGDDVTLADFGRRAYGYAGVGVRKMSRRADGAIVIKQKSWNFYRNPLTDELSDQIPNLWTGVTDTAPPMSGPVSETVLEPKPNDADKTPYNMTIRKLGKHAFVSTASTARFQSGGITWYKLEGNLDAYQCLAADLTDEHLTHIPNTYSQNLIAEWQTWTKMHGRPGHILFKGNGVPLFDAREVPDDLIAAIAKFFPGQFDEVKAWG